MNKDQVYSAFEKVGLYNGRVICGSKSVYRNSFPKNLIVFNANIINAKTKEKIWFGDLDITFDFDKLKKIAEQFDTEYLILLEMDARFENENNPKIENYIWSTKTGIGQKYKKYFNNDTLKSHISF
jgi:hypothetical protein